MKPNFALTLSFDGIGLLHRGPAGWHMVGEVWLDTPDLTAELAVLRRTAIQLDAAGLRSKLVIPNEQIRYLTLPAPDDKDSTGMARHIEAALDGATPYAVADLSYDWVCVGHDLHIAAVARETLEEAESFATEHGFSPVSFVAIPDPGGFPGEPFFGQTRAAAQLLDADDRLMRDTHAIRVLGAVRGAEAVSEAEAPDNLTEPAPMPQATAEAEDAAEAMLPDPAAQDSPAGDADQEAAEAPPPAFASIRAARAEPAPTDPSDAAPEPDRTAPPPQAAQRDIPPAPAAFRSPPPPPQAPAASGLSGLLSRAARRAGPEAAAQKTTPTPRQNARSEKRRMTVFGARPPEGDTTAIGGKPRFLGLMLTTILLVFLAAVAAWSALFTEEGLSGLFSRDSRVAQQPLTPAPQQTADPALTEAEAEPDTLDIELAMLDDDMLSDIDAEELDGYDPDLPPLDEPVSEVLPEAIPGEETAQQIRDAALSSYAATGIWQIAPAQPETAEPGSLDDLYIASIDESLPNFDAVALPDPGGTGHDRQPRAQSSPAASGTRFALDPRGLVTATPEGAETPDGVMVYAGRPALTPDEIPTRFERNPQAETETETAAADLTRPRLRPETLAENAERAQLGGMSRGELAGFRPRARPDTLAAVVQALRETSEPDIQPEEDSTTTAQAIATSLKPLARPRNFATTVETARSRQQPAAQQQPQQQVASAAAVAPQQRSAAPQIPSSASVAQQATVRGAINLRQVNLIGVYGQPSNRRALVRLSNGRYQKVQVGDRLDGGRVAAIGESELSYVKGNRSIVLTLPRG